MKKIPLAFLLIFALSLSSFLLYKRYKTEATVVALPVESELQRRYLSLYPKAALPLILHRNLLKNPKWQQPIFEKEMSEFVVEIIASELSRSGRRDIRPLALLASAAEFDVLLYAMGYTHTLAEQQFMLQTLSRRTGKVLGESQIMYIDEGDDIEAEIAENGKSISIVNRKTGKIERLLKVGEDGKISLSEL